MKVEEMIIKVNQVTRKEEVLLLSSASIVGIGISKTPADNRNFLSIEDAVALRAHVTSSRLAVFCEESSGFGNSEVQEVLDRLRADYLECNIPNLYHQAEYDAFLDMIGGIRQPTIVSGFAFSPDDLETLGEELFLAEIAALGVAFFQFAVDSVLDDGFLIPRKTARVIESLFAKYPVLVSDRFVAGAGPGFENARGVYLNLGRRTRGAAYDDYTLAPTSFSITEARRLLEQFSRSEDRSRG